MFRNTGTRVVSLLLAFSGIATAADALPPLTGPVVNSPANPPNPAPKPATTVTAPPRPETGPVLVIPGVTAPSRSRTSPRTVSPPQLEPEAPREIPSLDIPKELLEPTPSLNAREIPSQPMTRSSSPPILESTPVGPQDRARPTVTPSRTMVQPSGPTPAPPPPRRPTGFLSRLFPSTTTPTRSAESPRGSVTVEPRADPATDASLQRRIERQVRDAAGDRLRSYEVHVVDRNVTIRARAARFWQKRAIRHTLETLPGLQGYRTVVNMVD